jgi:hypothetical protein
MNGTPRNSRRAKFDPASTTSSATKAIKPPHQRSSRTRPRRDASHSRQGMSIAIVLPAAAASVEPTSSQRCRAPVSSARPASTTAIEAQPSQ